MPKRPKFIHPMRQVRTCLRLSQAAFAARLGCSTITIQRIENGSLDLSDKMANAVLEATGADPQSLRAGPTATALDMMGEEYSKSSFDFYHRALPTDEREFRYLVLSLSHYIQLMLLASNRANQLKMRAVFNALQNAFMKIAHDFRLSDGIHKLLVEGGHVDKRKYRVSDLRKFPDYARIIGFKDDTRFSPNRIISYNRPRGWITDYVVIENPILPSDADIKLRPDADYIIDNDRPIPEALIAIIDQALYWEIKEFRRSFTASPQKA